MAARIEEYGECPDCAKPFEEIMGSCRGCGSDRDPIRESHGIL